MASTTVQSIKKSPIGITLPIRDGSNGYFEQSFDIFTQTRANILNLINTRRGERRMNPMFGTRLYSLVFEQNTDALIEIAKNTLKEDITMWIPNVTVQYVDVSLMTPDAPSRSNDIDNYILRIAVNYIVNLTNQQDSVNLIVSRNQ